MGEHGQAVVDILTVAAGAVIHAGMGALPHPDGVAFRLWAPQATNVSVRGSFNSWATGEFAMAGEDGGHWYVDVPGAGVGDEYRYRVTQGGRDHDHIDPYAMRVSNSAGNAVVGDGAFDWEDDDFQIAPWNELVIYELHVGTFSREPGNANGLFAGVAEKFAHLRRLGINAIQIMPVAEFAGDRSWGYNPSHIFAVESSYGGPSAFRRFVKEAHRYGFAVILDVVYNHFGPSDLDLWQFGGWHEYDQGGIYFYNDWRNHTPWGATRPDYGRPEVRAFIRDNALMWLRDYHLDGLRWDQTAFIRSVNTEPSQDLPDGWRLMRDVTAELRELFPHKLLIAEDMQNDPAVTRMSGGGFGSQWDAAFVHPIRAALITPRDEERSMSVVRDALMHRYNDDVFQRVVYTESHDEVANGRARVPEEIAPGDAGAWAARKRSAQGAALVLTAPGIPMLFQGQEFLSSGWFQDSVGLDWELATKYSGVLRLYTDLVALRLNRAGVSRGLSGQGINVHHVNEADRMIAYHRWHQSAPRGDVVVVMNFANHHRTGYRVGFPRAGRWKLRFNSDGRRYGEDYCGSLCDHVLAEAFEYDGQLAAADVECGPYSVLMFSQDE